jgi:DNA-binding GntR family transcriptional regulator
MIDKASTKPQRRALGEWAVDTLYEQIFTGVLPVGADMAEESLCERLEVSRATVGLALRQLEQDGMLELAAGNGRRQVVAFSTGDVEDLYDIRLALESFTAERAASRSSTAAITQLQSLQDEMERLSRRPDRPTRRDFGIDFDFHRVIARESGSKRAVVALQPVWNQTHALLRHLYSVGVYADAPEDAASYRDHREIISSLINHNPEGARRAMAQHLSKRRETLLAGLARQAGRAIQDS